MLKNLKVVKNLQNCWKNYDFLNVDEEKNHVNFVKRLAKTPAKTYWNRKMWHYPKLEKSCK